MNKPIMNGVDVSECAYFKINRGFNCYKGHNCTDKECSDCYFKQLKRLQEENKKLKEVTNEAKIEHENLLINRNDFAERAEKYRQALEEIRGFLNPTYFDCKNCKELKKPFAQQNCNGFRYETILNKINEVLEDNKNDN